ncbi:hypothetical protein GGR56DRAFT_536854 [Xylariaceae sp. FL0804]|nr:hypothetical protein GGR56DRAFT_536854 [Xylariaceae sp. FL0804]
MQLPSTFGAILAGFLLVTAPAVGRPFAPLTVTQFEAGATPHSSIGYVELTLAPALGRNASQCTASPATYQVFPTVEQTACDDPAASFNLTRAEDGGADLALWYKHASGKVAYGVHHIDADDIVYTNQESPTGTVQVYAGPQNFTVQATYTDA